METITRKSLLYKSGVEYADFCLNHVVGCSHGCKYPCYAFLLKKRYGIVKTYEEWCNPRLVSNSMELLEMEIPRYRKIIHYVHLCFSTDPFMYGQDEVSNLTLKILEKLNTSSIPCTILTKGIFPEEIAHNRALSQTTSTELPSFPLTKPSEKHMSPTRPHTENASSLLNICIKRV